jgi:hypothetical protein
MLCCAFAIDNTSNVEIFRVSCYQGITKDLFIAARDGPSGLELVRDD